MTFMSVQEESPREQPSYPDYPDWAVRYALPVSPPILDAEGLKFGDFIVYHERQARMFRELLECGDVMIRMASRVRGWYLVTTNPVTAERFGFQPPTSLFNRIGINFTLYDRSAVISRVVTIPAWSKSVLVPFTVDQKRNVSTILGAVDGMVVKNPRTVHVGMFLRALQKQVARLDVKHVENLQHIIEVPVGFSYSISKGRTYPGKVVFSVMSQMEAARLRKVS